MPKLKGLYIALGAYFIVVTPLLYFRPQTPLWVIISWSCLCGLMGGIYTITHP